MGLLFFVLILLFFLESHTDIPYWTLRESVDILQGCCTFFF